VNHRRAATWSGEFTFPREKIIPSFNCATAFPCSASESEQFQRTDIVSLRVGHERIGERVGRIPRHLVRRLGAQRERLGCSRVPGECGQQYPSIDVSAHLLCLAILSAFANDLACQKVSTSTAMSGAPTRTLSWSKQIDGVGDQDGRQELQTEI
jgi:hypothetical protein